MLATVWSGKAGGCGVRITLGSVVGVALGRAVFDALTRLVREVPAHAVDYPDTAKALELAERMWSEAA